MSNASIPLVDLKAQYAIVGAEIDQAIKEVINRSDFILGEDLSLFEEEFAHFSGTRHAIGVGSGTEALHLGMVALGIGSGDEVIVPAMTFAATAFTVSYVGATPKFVDVERKTALISPAAIEAAITPRTKAIVPVHLYGQCANMTEICAIARRHGLAIIEDAAQAHGASHDGLPAGAIGDIGCFSFYPGKNLGAYGDGGAITTNDDKIAERIRFVRNWGGKTKYQHDEIGISSRLDTLQAAILRVKLRHLREWTVMRRRIAAEYDKQLASLPHVTLTQYDAGAAFHLYVVRMQQRDMHLEALKAAGIGAQVHYPYALHEHKAYASLGYKAGEFPESEAWARTCLSLPIYPELPMGTPARVAGILALSQIAA
jgi:dTDP-4-amino-4,6-dideoxygalactose transaminase